MSAIPVWGSLSWLFVLLIARYFRTQHSALSTQHSSLQKCFMPQLERQELVDFQGVVLSARQVVVDDAADLPVVEQPPARHALRREQVFDHPPELADEPRPDGGPKARLLAPYHVARQKSLC